MKTTRPHLKLRWQWYVDDDKARIVDPSVLDVLRAIQYTGSLAQAVRETGVSFRHGWGLLGKWEGILGRPLVAMARGRGARLTEFGQRLLEADQSAAERLSAELERLAREANASLAEVIAAPRTIRICASHDLALERVREALPKDLAESIDLEYRGSLDSLAALARGECEIAGFHFAVGPAGRPLLARYRRLLQATEVETVDFVHRVQGLLLAAGNPRKIRTLADLAKRKLRFINRQRGSGTRSLLDALIEQQQLDPSLIPGYQSVEFTHAAIAATVASGKADAGFAIEAAAREFGLDFLPLAEERYVLAVRRETAANPVAKRFLASLRRRECRRLIDSTPGYSAKHCGKPIDLSNFWSWPGPG